MRGGGGCVLRRGLARQSAPIGFGAALAALQHCVGQARAEDRGVLRVTPGGEAVDALAIERSDVASRRRQARTERRHSRARRPACVLDTPVELSVVRRRHRADPHVCACCVGHARAKGRHGIIGCVGDRLPNRLSARRVNNEGSSTKFASVEVIREIYGWSLARRELRHIWNTLRSNWGRMSQDARDRKEEKRATTPMREPAHPTTVHRQSSAAGEWWVNESLTARNSKAYAMDTMRVASRSTRASRANANACDWWC
jgi:hypothetical protein